jgi:hypothetical protein
MFTPSLFTRKHHLRCAKLANIVLGAAGEHHRVSIRASFGGNDRSGVAVPTRWFRSDAGTGLVCGTIASSRQLKAIVRDIELTTPGFAVTPGTMAALERLDHIISRQIPVHRTVVDELTSEAL